MKVLVLGATGFVGQATLRRLAADGVAARIVSRSPRSTADAAPAAADEWISVGPYEHVADWDDYVTGVTAIIYLAARVHVMNDRASNAAALYRTINADVPVRIAEAAARRGVRRFVYVSSIKVNGERTDDRPFDERSAAAPLDDYGRSKAEAEQRLNRSSAETGLSIVSIRPPLVYGPGVGGNLTRLIGLARLARTVPLPLGAIHNRRSLVYVDHLADALVRAAITPRPLAPLYLVADPEPVSTPQLIRTLGAAMGIAPRLLPVPPALLRAAAAVVGRRAEIQRLTESLEVDASAARRDLEWRSPTSLRDGLAAMLRGQSF